MDDRRVTTPHPPTRTHTKCLLSCANTPASCTCRSGPSCHSSQDMATKLTDRRAAAAASCARCNRVRWLADWTGQPLEKRPPAKSCCLRAATCHAVRRRARGPGAALRSTDHAVCLLMVQSGVACLRRSLMAKSADRAG
eukprot:364550-Chlamydomonas_euryale.AAC.5